MGVENHSSYPTPSKQYWANAAPGSVRNDRDLSCPRNPASPQTRLSRATLANEIYITAKGARRVTDRLQGAHGHLRIAEDHRQLGELINERVVHGSLKEQRSENGMITLRQDGFARIFARRYDH